MGSEVAIDRSPRPWWLAVAVAAAMLLVAAVLYVALGYRGGREDILTPVASDDRIVSEVAAGSATVVLEAVHGSMGIADLLEVTLTVDGPVGALVTLPKLDGETGAFSVESRDAVGPVTVDAERRRWMRTYILEPLEVGTLATPPLTVIFQEAVEKDRIDTLRIDAKPLAIEVTTVLPPDANIGQPRGILGPVPLPEAERPLLWPWMAGAGLVLAGLAYIVRRLLRRGGDAAAAEPEQSTAHSALAVLERMDATGSVDDIEGFHIRIATILRDYAERRFDVPAGHLTTQEVAALAAARGGTDSWGGRLTWVLERCDLVKFARLRPSSAAMTATRTAAIDFIRDTSDEPGNDPS